jgi:hypothetical protein
VSATVAATLGPDIRDELPAVAVGLEPKDMPNRGDGIVGNALLQDRDGSRPAAFRRCLGERRRARRIRLARVDDREGQLGRRPFRRRRDRRGLGPALRALVARPARRGKKEKRYEKR